MREELNIDRILIYSFIAVAIVLLSVPLIRFYKDVPEYPLGESYHSLRIAGILLQDPAAHTDALQVRPYYPELYHYLLMGLERLFAPSIGLFLLPLLSGLGLALMLNLIMKQFDRSDGYRGASLLVLAASPAFIFAFSGLVTEGLYMLLAVCSLYFLIHEDILKKAAGLVLLIILALSSLAGFLVTIGALIALTFLLKKRMRGALAVILIALLFLIPFWLATGYFAINIRELSLQGYALQDSLTIFGATSGYGLFVLLLFLIGMFSDWANSKRNRLLHLAVLLFVFLGFLNLQIRFYMTAVIIFYCTHAIFSLYRREWELDIIRSGTMILVICALVFSCLNQITTLVNAEPDAKLATAMRELRQERGTGLLLSQPEYGAFAQYSSGKRTFLDATSAQRNDYSSLQQVKEKIFDAVRISDALPLLTQNNIEFILVTPKMRENIWDGHEEGLLFLMSNSGRFDLIYESGGLQLWRFDK